MVALLDHDEQEWANALIPASQKHVEDRDGLLAMLAVDADGARPRRSR